jgi:hypothetical protein
MKQTGKSGGEGSRAPMSSMNPRSLGPSDSSDSGSDGVGQEQSGDDDVNVPVDVAVRGDARRPGQSIETPGSETNTDAAGTGERRSAGNDAGDREASDIGPDRIERPLDDGDATPDANLPP